MIVPHVLPLQPAPARLQVTFVSVAPVTVAMNCRRSSTTTWTTDGDRVTFTGGRMVTVAVPEELLSSTDVAFTVTMAGLGTAAGATYRPAEEMVPQLPPVHPVPDTLQVTL